MTITDRRGRTVDGTDSSAQPTDPNPGTAIKTACIVATTANIVLSGLQTIDGVAVVENDRVLVKSQTTGSENGIYTASSGNWSRATDWDGTHEVVQGTVIFVAGGTLNANSQFAVTTANPIVIGTTSVAFTSLGVPGSYTGQETITTLGTISTGVWQATTVAVSYGGTGLTGYALGDILYSSAANTLAKLSGNTAATRKFLRQTGTGAVSAAPAWDTILAADVPGSAITRTNDTNVTLTLGGSPTTAVLNATSITVGWTGTLAAARLNSNVVQAITNDTNLTGSIATQTLTLGWTGTLAVARGGTGDSGTAWTIYTPTVTSGSGTITSASASGAYKQIGKTVFCRVSVTITTNGTGATSVNFTLPVGAKTGTRFFNVGLNNSSGTYLMCYTDNAAGLVGQLFTLAAAYPGADSTNLLTELTYEAA